MDKKIGVVILFLILGILFSVFTEKYMYYIPTSLVVGILVALFVVKNK